MNGIFVGHHERTDASVFLSESVLLRGTRVQRKTADQQWDSEFIRKCPGVQWMLIAEEAEVRPPPVPAVVMPAPEARVRTSGREQRVTKQHSDECRARMDELMQRDEDALVPQRLHADRLGVRSGLPAESSEDAPRVGGAQSGRRCRHETMIEKISRITT